MRRVALVAARLLQFGVREAGFRDLIAEAGQRCFVSQPHLRRGMSMEKKRQKEGVFSLSFYPLPHLPL